MPDNDAWPALPLSAWQETHYTLHMLAQMVGKIRLRLAAPEPEWGQVALYVTPRGLTTSPIPYPPRSFQIDFDLIGHRIEVVASDGESRSIALGRRSVAEYYRELMETLRAMRLGVRIWPVPVEVPKPVRFDEDTTHAAYDAEQARRFLHILIGVDSLMKEHRAPYRDRQTLVQFFFGTFDLAYARFSGRPATPPRNDLITRVAMDREEICVGFWPGDERFAEPAFWCYAFPKPAETERLSVRPSAAFWSEEAGLFLLRYEDVCRSDSPREMVR
ncbi:MAG TPA: DUF5996 family protein, partial [Xanthobacteraceae bacterium]